MSILVVAETASAESVLKPAVPEFTVEIVDRSYDVPKTYTTTTDPFTGEQVTTSSGGYRVTNKTIDIKIKNQQYSKTFLDNGSAIQLYYTVRTKGHFVDWVPVANLGYSFTRVLASTSEYTVLTIRIGADNDIVMGRADVVIPDGGQEDVQVNAHVGCAYIYYEDNIIPAFHTEYTSLAESGWSNIQTLSITGDSTSVSPSTSFSLNPTATSGEVPISPTPSIPELSFVVILPLLAFIPLIAVAIHKKQGL